MKDEIEETIMDWLKTLTLDDEPIADMFIIGRADKPSGVNSAIVVDLHKPISTRPKEHRIGSNRKEVIGQGTITGVWKAVDDDGNIIENAERLNDKVPDMISDKMFDDPTLGGIIPGEIIPILQETGYLENKGSDDNYPFVSYILFEYKGLWVSPDI